MEKNNGITLIALVITIIIMIILAGIVISLTIGENGIIERAKKSRLTYEEQQAKEKLEIVLLDMQADKETNSGYNKDEYLTNKIKEQGMIVNGDVVTVDGWRFEIDRNVPEISKKLEEETLVSKINNNPLAYYGKKVSGYTANGISDWRIFYADDENVFLITTDYITADLAKASNNTMTKYSTYRVYWSSEPAVSSIKNVAKFSPVTNETMAWTGNYGEFPNGKMCSTLLDTDKWTAFLDKEDGTGKGTMAIGSPTLNMWIASWNKMSTNTKLYCNASNSYGYFLGVSSSPFGYTQVFVNSADEYKKSEVDNMYFPHKTRLEDTCEGYWIASPMER